MKTAPNSGAFENLGQFIIGAMMQAGLGVIFILLLIWAAGSSIFQSDEQTVNEM